MIFFSLLCIFLSTILYVIQEWKVCLRFFFRFCSLSYSSFDHNEVFCFCGFLRVFFVDVSKNRKEMKQCWWWELHARASRVLRWIFLSRFSTKKCIKSKQEKKTDLIGKRVKEKYFLVETFDSLWQKKFAWLIKTIYESLLFFRF